jgi:FimV-like protein
LEQGSEELSRQCTEDNVMKRLAILPIIFWSIFVSAFDWEAPVATSHQGEPLEVRIGVKNLGSASAAQLFPLLASESEFTARGIDRPAFLSGLKYFVDSNEGQVDLVVRTATAWTQPDLTTLVEVFTPDGPVYIPVSVIVERKPLAKPIVAQDSSKPRSVTKPKPPEVRVTIRGPERKGSKTVAKEPNILFVRNGSTLWRLAKRIQPADLTIEQVMMALYDENPDAFEYNNVNALEQGKTLTVPDMVRMGQESSITAKQRFDEHMRAPKKDFPRTTRVQPPAVERISKTPDEPSLEYAPTVTLKAVNEMAEDDTGPVSLAGPASALTTAAGPTAMSTIVKETVVEEQLPEASQAMSPSVTELLEKMTNLENKVDEMDALVESISSKAQLIEQSPLVPSPESNQVIAQFEALQDWIPTPTEIEEFLSTELGKGTLIFLTISILTILGFRIFGGQQSTDSEPVEVRSPQIPERAALSVRESQTSLNSVDPSDASEALESAIERLKSKIADPGKLQEVKEIYSAADDVSIDAGSGDVTDKLEWGRDPDVEAETALHQLELAQNYLKMGMSQAAFEILERAAVSTHTESADAARSLIDTLRR